MTITTKNDGGQFVDERGSTLPVAVVKALPTNLDGSPVVDGYSTAGIYVDNTVRAAGRGILCIITIAGTATLTFGGQNIVFTFVVGPLILPLAVTKTLLGTAVGAFYAIS